MTVENNLANEKDFSILKELLQEASKERDPEKTQGAQEKIYFILGIMKSFWPHKFIRRNDNGLVDENLQGEINAILNP